MKKSNKILLLVLVLVLSLVLATACETLENHEHKADDSIWFSDGTNHWHVCTFKGCAEELDKTACSGGIPTSHNQHVLLVATNTAKQTATVITNYNKLTSTSQLLKLAS